MNLSIRNKKRSVTSSEVEMCYRRKIHFSTSLEMTILMVSFFISSCSQKTSEAPANIIPRETFVNVLVDFALAESAANSNIKNVPNNKADSVYNFNPLEENKITKAQYDSALEFYASHTELYKDIYQEILQKLNAMQTRRDSLKNKK